MTITIDEVSIDTDCQDALAIAHDVDALINEQSPWDYNDCDGVDFFKRLVAQ